MRPKDIPKMLNTNRATLIHVIIKLSEVKDKERVLKAARGNREAVNKRTSHNTISHQKLSGQERMGWHIQNIGIPWRNWGFCSRLLQ